MAHSAYYYYYIRDRNTEKSKCLQTQIRKPVTCLVLSIENSWLVFQLLCVRWRRRPYVVTNTDIVRPLLSSGNKASSNWNFNTVYRMFSIRGRLLLFGNL